MAQTQHELRSSPRTGARVNGAFARSTTRWIFHEFRSKWRQWKTNRQLASRQHEVLRISTGFPAGDITRSTGGASPLATHLLCAGGLQSGHGLRQPLPQLPSHGHLCRVGACQPSVVATPGKLFGPRAVGGCRQRSRKRGVRFTRHCGGVGQNGIRARPLQRKAARCPHRDEFGRACCRNQTPVGADGPCARGDG